MDFIGMLFDSNKRDLARLRPDARRRPGKQRGWPSSGRVRGQQLPGRSGVGHPSGQLREVPQPDAPRSWW